MSCGRGNKISRGSHTALSNLHAEQNFRQASERKGKGKKQIAKQNTDSEVSEGGEGGEGLTSLGSMLG